jgi:hypothetical protein
MNASNIPQDNRKGKILRIKQGYNPNSSSLGSMVYVLPAALLAITVGFGAISSIIMSAFIKHDAKSADNNETQVLKK